MTLPEFRSALPELRRLRAITVALWGLDTDEKLAWQKRAQELIQKQQLEAPAHNRRLNLYGISSIRRRGTAVADMKQGRHHRVQQQGFSTVEFGVRPQRDFR